MKVEWGWKHPSMPSPWMVLEPLYILVFIFHRCDVFRGRRPRQGATEFSGPEESPLPSPSEKLPLHGESGTGRSLCAAIIIHGHAQTQRVICVIHLAWPLIRCLEHPEISVLTKTGHYQDRCIRLRFITVFKFWSCPVSKKRLATLYKYLSFLYVFSVILQLASLVGNSSLSFQQGKCARLCVTECDVADLFLNILQIHPNIFKSRYSKS